MNSITRRNVLVGAAAAAFVADRGVGLANAVDARLKDQARARGILYGSAATSPQLFANNTLTALILGECACIVPEAEMKWGEMTGRDGKEDLSWPDRFVDFASKHELAVRGHTLLWFDSTPGRFKQLSSRSSAEAAMLRHVTDMCSRYRGRVICWDVVNEAIELGDGRPDGLRKAVFLDRIGPEYLDLAHHAARAADPQAALVLNDYGQVYDTPSEDAKRAASLRLLERMKKAGTPIDAVGIEAHLDIGAHSLSQAKLRQFFAEIAAMGLKIHITELDVSDRRSTASIAARDRLVADEYERFLDAALAEPAVNVVITWGLSDRDSWLNSAWGEPSLRRGDGQLARPLPFDVNFVPKPAWSALVRAFQGAPSRPAMAPAPARGGAK